MNGPPIGFFDSLHLSKTKTGSDQLKSLESAKPRNSCQIHIDLEDDDERSDATFPADGAATGRTTFEFDNFDAHIDIKENSELRKPRERESSGSDFDNKNEEIRNLRRQVHDLKEEVNVLKFKN